MEHCVAALPNGLRPYDFLSFRLWPIVDDVTCNVREVTFIASGPVVVGRTGNSWKRHLMFGLARLVHSKTSTKTGSGH